MRRLLAMVALLSACNGVDSERAEEALRIRGFTEILVSEQRFSYACRDAWSCTGYTAHAPWGWTVTGVVTCRVSGSCEVAVLFREPPKNAVQSPKPQP